MFPWTSEVLCRMAAILFPDRPEAAGLDPAAPIERLIETLNVRR